MLSIIVYIFLLFVTTASCFSPVGRQSAAAIQDGPTIWFYGGLVAGSTTGTASVYSRDFFALNISESWETSSPLWTDYSYESTLIPIVGQPTLQMQDNSSLWMFGNLASFYQYDMHTSQWSVPKLSSSSASVPKIANSPTLVSNSRGIIYYGGQLFNATTLNNLVWTLNANQFTILPITNNPVGRMYHTATLVNDTLMYIIGGVDKVNTAIPASMKSIYIYNTITNLWSVENTTNPPQDRIDHTAVLSQDGNSIIIFGGENFTTFFNDVWVLDVNTFAWKSPSISGNLPTATAGSNAFLIDSQMLLTFGAGPNNNFQNTVFVLNTTNWTWLPSFTAPIINTSLPTNTSNSTSTSATPSAYNSTSTQKSGGIGTGAIIGATTGGTIIFFGIVAFGIYSVRRRLGGITPSSGRISKFIEGGPEYEKNWHITKPVGYEKDHHILKLIEGKNSQESNRPTGKNAYESNRHIPNFIEYERKKPDEYQRIKPDEYQKIKPDEYKGFKPNEYKQSKPDER